MLLKRNVLTEAAIGHAQTQVFLHRGRAIGNVTENQSGFVELEKSVGARRNIADPAFLFLITQTRKL